MHPIARYRRVRGWTQTQLAAQIDVSLNTVQRWEMGRMPRPRYLVALAEAIRVEPMELQTALEEWVTQREQGGAAA